MIHGESYYHLSSSICNYLYVIRWSFGGNRLSVKAEIRLIADVSAALRELETVGSSSTGALKSLASKQDLLLSLLANEQMRLEVWLSPLDHERKHLFSSANASKLSHEVSISRLTALNSSDNKYRQTS